MKHDYISVYIHLLSLFPQLHDVMAKTAWKDHSLAKFSKQCNVHEKGRGYTVRYGQVLAALVLNMVE